MNVYKKRNSKLFCLWKEAHVLLLLLLSISSSSWPIGWSPCNCNLGFLWPDAWLFSLIVFPISPLSQPFWIIGNLLKTAWCFNHSIFELTLSFSKMCFTFILPAWKYLSIYATNFNLGVDPSKMSSSASSRINFSVMTQQMSSEYLRS